MAARPWLPGQEIRRRTDRHDRKSVMALDNVRAIPGDKALLTIEAVAELLDTSVDQVRNMRSRGQIPEKVAGKVMARKVPGLGLRFNSDAVRAWVAGLVV
jgi:hypothetical protein